MLSVLSGIKDFCKVLDIPYAESDKLSKDLQKLLDKPQAKFKDYDALLRRFPLDTLDPLGFPNRVR